MLTLKEASDAVRLTKPALLKAIQKGRLSATRSDNGEWQIDPAELFRVYAPAKTETGNLPETGLQKEIDALQRELHLKEDWINELKAQIADLRTDRDHWREQARIVLLTHQTKTEPQAPPAPAPEEPAPPPGAPSRRRWWPFRRGANGAGVGGRQARWRQA
jgi:uncharacterized coiled-coil protein SlyX